MKRRLLLVCMLIVALVCSTCVTYADIGDYLVEEYEPNNSQSLADSIYHDDTVTGYIGEYDVDYFEFVMTEDGEVYIPCLAARDTAIIGIQDEWGDYIAATYIDEYSSGDYYGELYVDLLEGTYYVVLLDTYEYNTYNEYMFYLEKYYYYDDDYEDDDNDYQDCYGPLDTPQIWVSTDAATGHPKVTWNEVEGVDYYDIWRKAGANGEWEVYDSCEEYETSYIDYNTTPGVTYYYQLQACCDYYFSCDSDYSVTKSITCDLAKPRNVQVNPVASSGKPKVTWNSVSGADKYYVYRATSSNGSYSFLGSTYNTHYTNTGAVAGKTYYYKVKAVDVNNEYANSALSDRCYMTCDLAKPTSVKVTNDSSSGKPRVTWLGVEGADKYYVYRATSSSGEYTYMYSTTNTSYTNTSAVAGKTYYYKVMAVDANNKYANSALSDRTYITCDLASPKNVKITLSNNKPKVTWSKVDGATSYAIYRKVGTNGTYSKYYTTSYTSFTNSGATKGTKYYYKVVAICGSNSYGNSAYSSAVSITSK